MIPLERGFYEAEFSEIGEIIDEVDERAPGEGKMTEV